MAHCCIIVWTRAFAVGKIHENVFFKCLGGIALEKMSLIKDVACDDDAQI